jgi:predicted dehydrogenase
MNASLKIGLLGCGYWGLNYVRVFSELPKTTMLVACDVEPQRLERVQQRFPRVELCCDPAAVIGDPRLDAIVVATPSASHFHLVSQCLLHDKHVLVEKPMVMAVPEGEALVDLARQRERILMVGHTFLYNPGIQKMRECLQADSFGKVYYLHSTRTNLGPIRKDASVLWDLAPHDVAIFCYLLDAMPSWVAGIGARALGNGRDDVAFVSMAFAQGVLAHIHVSWIDPNKVREVVAVGSLQRIVFDDLNNVERIRIFEKGVAPVPAEVDNFGEFRLQVRDGAIYSPQVEAREPLKSQCAHFLECIRHGRQPLSNARNGLDVVRVLAAIEQSMQQNGARIPLLPSGESPPAGAPSPTEAP